MLVSNYVVAPQDATTNERLIYSIAPFIIAVLIAVGVAYAGAFIRAPYEQRDALRAKTGQLNRQILDQSPDLEGRILQVVTPPDVPDGTLAFVNLTIRNRGFQSVVDHDWDASITLGGTKRPAELPALQGTTTLVMAESTPIVLTPADAIYEKAINNPIARGAQISGWLPMWVSGVRTDQFVRLGNVVEVRFKDFLGQSYMASYPFDGETSGRAHYFPGSQNPVAPKTPDAALPGTPEKGKR